MEFEGEFLDGKIWNGKMNEYQGMYLISRCEYINGENMEEKYHNNKDYKKRDKGKCIIN